ncbi:MAG: helix-turn-helix domain-containing protein [Acholeplasmataceae bacterium]|nr:helix-turn-helix domain-containing protein [Acholeplasmataceae bacterium]
MGKHYTDRQRLDMVKKYRQSGLGLSEFARLEHLNRSTFKDWVAAYNHLQGDFIRIDNLDSKPGVLMDEDDMKLNILKDDEITKKSSHFTRFDHSIVVIETKEMKITTSLEQALRIVGLLYDRL